MDISQAFDQLQSQTKAAALISESIINKRDTIESSCRLCLRTLADLHTKPPNEYKTLCQGLLDGENFNQLKSALNDLRNEMANKPFYKYNHIWSHAMQDAIFVCLMAHWPITQKLLSPREVQDMLAIPCEGGQEENAATTPEELRFRFTIEEYLHAVVSLSNELARLAVNAVTLAMQTPPDVRAQCLSLPADIDRFLKELQAAFMVLNLKNDSLRRRFDSIKYNVKKVEEVVYNVALRVPSLQ